MHRRLLLLLTDSPSADCLDDVKHIGIVGEGEGSTSRIFFKLGLEGPNIDIAYPTPEAAQQALKNIQKVLGEAVIEY